jgi:hypothetical protein
VAGVVHGALVVSVRNLGYSRNAGEMVRRIFADLGSAGGHRAMAKAVVPLAAFREKFGVTDPHEVADAILDMSLVFLLGHRSTGERRKETSRV